MNQQESPVPTRVSARLVRLGLDLPASSPPVVAGYSPLFVPFRRSGNQIHVSGRLAKRDGRVWVGKVGGDVSLADAHEAARGTALELVSVLRDAVADLETIRLVKLLVFVNGAPDFLHPHQVADAASARLIDIFSDRGAHARSAVSVAQCPFGACLEIELLAEVQI